MTNPAPWDDPNSDPLEGMENLKREFEAADERAAALPYWIDSLELQVLRSVGREKP